jgi:hypothetical protein
MDVIALTEVPASVAERFALAGLEAMFVPDALVIPPPAICPSRVDAWNCELPLKPLMRNEMWFAS